MTPPVTNNNGIIQRKRENFRLTSYMDLLKASVGRRRGGRSRFSRARECPPTTDVPLHERGGGGLLPLYGGMLPCIWRRVPAPPPLLPGTTFSWGQDLQSGFMRCAKLFRSARTSCRTFDFSTPLVPSTRPPVPSRTNFSWVLRWAVTLPSGLWYPSNRIFSESWWCQPSKFGRKYKDKYRDKYKYSNK